MTLRLNPQDSNYYELIDNGDYKISQELTIEIDNFLGNDLTFKVLPGYITDFRTGPKIIVDLLTDVPQIGDLRTAMCWLIHDITLMDFYLEKKLICFYFRCWRS
ncbi:hypothetical protein [Flammeovirga sp. SubArs3]|uniref:hypothetical protein n=1 Tax=Flammeovirga sp. SubArs3 TaxID=2995316 RepID=UPI00248D190E|nr:hypothetical protein [Flammeovirga sp. SubArs3]